MNKTLAELKYDIHAKICTNLHQIYVSKNNDYGDSFSKTRKEFDNAILVRLSDKLERIKSLYKKTDRQVKDESIEDTLLDLANYAIMEVVERRLDKQKSHLANDEEDTAGQII